MAQGRKGIEKQAASFEERLAVEAVRIKNAAEKQPPGSTAREQLLRLARQAERVAHMSDGYGPASCEHRSKPKYGGENERLLRLLYRR